MTKVWKVTFGTNVLCETVSAATIESAMLKARKLNEKYLRELTVDERAITKVEFVCQAR